MAITQKHPTSGHSVIELSAILNKSFYSSLENDSIKKILEIPDKKWLKNILRL